MNILDAIVAAVQLGIKYGPQVGTAIEAGKPIFDAIKAAAPQLGPIVKQIAADISDALPSSQDIAKVENAVAEAIFRPMSPEDEKRWMDRASGDDDRGQRGSDIGG